MGGWGEVLENSLYSFRLILKYCHNFIICQFSFLVEKAKTSSQIHREVLVARLTPDKLPCLLDLITKIFIGDHQYITQEK